VFSAASENRSASAPIGGMPLGKFLRIAFCAASGVLSASARASICSRVAPCTTSRGSMTFPFVLLILSPFSSVTIAVRYTVRNGTFPMKCRPIIIIRATQKKMMSGPVTSTAFG
jgi:hypothetical protein